MAEHLLVANRLFDGLEMNGGGDWAVLLRDGQIAFSGHREQAPQPTGDRTVTEFADATLLPGLIDLHTHWYLDGSGDPRATLLSETPVVSALRCAHHAVETLRCGVTTVRDVGCGKGISLALREAIAAGWLVGPRVFASGNSITITGGHSHRSSGREADGPDDVRRAVREQLKAGADLIKIIASGGVYMNREDPTSPQFTLEELHAAVEEANAAGVSVAMHAEGAKSIENAIATGATTVEHGQYLTDQMAKDMAARGMVLVPTMYIFYNIAVNGDDLGAPSYAVRKAKDIVEVHRNGLAAALRHGVVIGAGTDVGGPLLKHHEFPLQRELEVMVEGGMPNLQALRSATSTAAQVVRDSSLGSLKAGAPGDVVVCSGNPGEDITRMRELLAVFKGGDTVAPRGTNAEYTARPLARIGR